MYCKKCGERFNNDYDYCPCCGEYKSFEERDLGRCSLVYGPPFNAKYLCSSCGKTFHIQMLGRPTVKYCPYCGKEYATGSCVEWKAHFDRVQEKSLSQIEEERKRNNEEVKEDESEQDINNPFSGNPFNIF